MPGADAVTYERLGEATAMIIGVRSTGIVAAKYLVNAGLGNLILIDEDPKALANAYKMAKEAVSSARQTEITCHALKLEAANADKLLQECDVVIDGLEDWQEKLLLSDICMQVCKPLIHAGGTGYRYQLFAMSPGQSACLRCVLPLVGIDDLPRETPHASYVTTVLGMVGAWQALESIKVIARIGATQGNELKKMDWLSGEFEIIRGLDPHRDCPDCGRTRRKRPTN